MSGIEIKSITTRLITKKNIKKASSPNHRESFSVETNDDNLAPTVSSAFGMQGIDPLFSNLLSNGSSHAASQKAEEVLDHLEKIRIALIQGQLASSTIESLAASIKNIPYQDDKKLQSIINDIETRALVELAKLEKLKTPQG